MRVRVASPPRSKLARAGGATSKTAKKGKKENNERKGRQSTASKDRREGERDVKKGRKTPPFATALFYQNTIGYSQ